MALAAYRHLLRSMKLAFLGDETLLHAARKQARASFHASRALEAGSPKAIESIAHAEGVAQVLRHNIVQGIQVEGSEILKLRIHEHTERGDNDTIKNPRGKGGVVKVGGV